MKIQLESKIPRSCGPPPLTKGANGGFIGVAAKPLRPILIPCGADRCMNYSVEIPSGTREDLFGKNEQADRSK